MSHQPHDYEKLAYGLQTKGIRDPRVLYAIGHTLRHVFMPRDMQQYATEDTALPIGKEQTISQPYVVAKMTEAIIGDKTPKKVLEIGTGSGYQAAILSQIADEVYSIERIKSLLERAQSAFESLELKNIHTQYGDGHQGWPEHAPFDAIVVTAATESAPYPLLEQLAEGGRLIIPLGDAFSQQLTLISRHANSYTQQVLDPVMFVPLKEGKD